MMIVLALGLQLSPAFAITFIRDAEIEALLKQYADPIFAVAGLPEDSVNIFIVQDDTTNAFVAGGRNMVFHTGLLKRMDTPEMLQAVIAHETGHIAGGHLARRSLARQRIQGPLLLSYLLGVAAAAAGSNQAGAAIISGGSSAVQRGFLSYTRSEEAAADQAAIRYLDEIGIDPVALIDVLRLLQRQQGYLTSSQNAYTHSHPLSRERIQLIENKVHISDNSRYNSDDQMLYLHRRMQAKLEGFLEHPERVLRRIRGDDSEYAGLSRAVAYYRLPNVQQALSEIDLLLEQRPDDAYYWELRGQILHESGRSNDAVQAYRIAQRLQPEETLLAIGLAKALLALETANAAQEALQVLRNVVRNERYSVEAWRLLSMAEGRVGEPAAAALAAAEMQALRGEIRLAKQQATRVQALTSRGSRLWLRAEDILALRE